MHRGHLQQTTIQDTHTHTHTSEIFPSFTVVEGETRFNRKRFRWFIFN